MNWFVGNSDAAYCLTLARYEIGWWKAHHRRNISGLVSEMAFLYSLQFNIPYDQATKAVRYRVAATQVHDRAEAFEDEGNQEAADREWKRAEDLLVRHFEVLTSCTRLSEG